MNGMTIKQIAELCGVSRRTVERWIVKADEEGATRVRQNVVGGVRQNGEPFVLKQRTLDAATKGGEAYFDVEEVVAIIRAGGNVTLAALLAQNAAQTAHIKALEARPRLALPAPVTDPAVIHDVRVLSESNKIEDRDVRRLLNLDTEYTPPKIPRGNYIIGTLQDLTERLFNVPFWPVRYTTLAKHLMLHDELTYRVARMCKAEPESITAEDAMKIARAVTCTPEPKALPGR